MLHPALQHFHLPVSNTCPEIIEVTGWPLFACWPLHQTSTCHSWYAAAKKLIRTKSRRSEINFHFLYESNLSFVRIRFCLGSGLRLGLRSGHLVLTGCFLSRIGSFCSDSVLTDWHKPFMHYTRLGPICTEAGENVMIILYSTDESFACSCSC